MYSPGDMPLDEIRISGLIKGWMKVTHCPMHFSNIIDQVFNNPFRIAQLELTLDETASALAKLSSNKRQFLRIVQSIKNRNVNRILDSFLKFLFLLLANDEDHPEQRRVLGYSDGSKIEQDETSITHLTLAKPFINWDFVEARDYNYTNFICTQSPTAQEGQLIEDLLNTFFGFHGVFIKPNGLQNPKDIRTFQISQNLCPSLRGIAERLLPVSSYYSRIIRFTQNNQSLSSGRVKQALASHLDDHLQQFSAVVLRIEDAWLRGHLRVVNMWCDLRESMVNLRVLNDIVTWVEDTKGGTTLTALHEGIKRTMSDIRAQSICCKATELAAVPYFETLKKWILHGVIFDPFDEFLVVKNSTIKYSSDWDGVFSFSSKGIPSFFHSVQDEIFRAGKYQDAIKKSARYKVPEHPDIELSYDYFNPSYLDTIRKAYDFARVNLIKLLVVDYDLVGRLKTAKAFYTLEYGDLFYNLIDNCMQELTRPFRELCASYLPSLALNSIETSSIKGLKYSNEIAIFIEKWSLLWQMSSFFKEDVTPNEPNDEIQGLEAITLKMKNDWPIGIVLHDSSTKCYQMLFRHLFHIRLVYMKLSKVHLKAYSLTKAQCYLKHCMIVFVSNCLSYMTQETIEVYWIDFCSAVTQAKYVEDLKYAHDNYQYLCMSGCLLTSMNHYTKLRKILDICSEFAQDFSIEHETGFMEALNELIISLCDETVPIFQNFASLIYPTFLNMNLFINFDKKIPEHASKTSDDLTESCDLSNV